MTITYKTGRGKNCSTARCLQTTASHYLQEKTMRKPSLLIVLGGLCVIDKIGDTTLNTPFFVILPFVFVHGLVGLTHGDLKLIAAPGSGHTQRKVHTRARIELII